MILGISRETSRSSDRIEFNLGRSRGAVKLERMRVKDHGAFESFLKRLRLSIVAFLSSRKLPASLI
jgi:hypothetical protein